MDRAAHSVEAKAVVRIGAAVSPRPFLGCAVGYSPSSTRYARHIDLRAKFVARMLKMRDYTPAYICTHSNIADQFTKIVDPVSFRRFRDWMANGLDDQ
jgi:hypothetical protein